MTDKLVRSCSKFMSAMSRPSILILPDDSSTKRRSATTRELLPDPVRPTIPETNPQNISQISVFVKQGWKACVPILSMFSKCILSLILLSLQILQQDEKLVLHTIKHVMPLISILYMTWP